VRPGDAKALADGMVRLLADGDTAAAMGRHGERLIASRYTWSHLAQRWAQLYGQTPDGG
jgi:glycosyltransferase involved in cell wall biosynthesis